ncbi:MAG: nitronate monooxygenase family protein [Coriobacteriales bacterium]|jgi:enoyl-[acyl-carrier protein] reductase II|nr:nitronate monooxygenase family protein [Coriobacteriales bacterium]
MTKLNELLKTRYPLIQGGMAQIATGGFAAAVSAAGGLGVIATGGFTAAQLREQIACLRGLTDRPFGVNLMLMHPEAVELAEIIAEEQVPVVTTGAGDPSRFVERWKAAGSLVVPVIPSVALARRMERTGADAVIAEGTESGGHVGELTTMALVPQVADALSIPVIAAGGIASGRQLCAAMALGAIGAQIGTVLLASTECPIHDNYKQAVLDAKDTGTVVTGRVSGTPIRALRNRMTREYLKLEERKASREEFEELSLGSLRRAVLDGDDAHGTFMCGQVAGMVSEIRPLATIFASLMEEFERVRKELTEL